MSNQIGVSLFEDANFLWCVLIARSHLSKHMQTRYQELLFERSKKLSLAISS